MTGLVYAVIIVLWGIVLVPLWLRRHDESRVRQTADQYNHAMNTLARASAHRRSHRHDRAEVHKDAPQTLEETGAGWSVQDVVSMVAAAVPTSANGTGRDLVARRRRRVIAVLGAGFLISVVGALVGLVPGLVPIAFLGLSVGYLTLLVRAGRASVPAATRSSAQRDAETSALRAATESARRRAFGVEAVAVDDVLAGRRPSVRIIGAGEHWEPQQAALPTYVTKPKASKVPRVLDLRGTHREWGGADMVEQVQADRQAHQRALQEAEARRRREAEEQFAREMGAVQPSRDREVEELANPWAPVDLSQYRRAANQ